MTFSLEKGCIHSPGWHPSPPHARPEAGYGFEGSRSPWCPCAKGWGRREGGRERGLAGPPTQRANIPLAQREGVAQPPQAFPLLLPLWGIKGEARVKALREEGRQAPPQRSGGPEPGLGEGDVGRGLLFQVPKTEVTTPAPWGWPQDRGLGPGRVGLAQPLPSSQPCLHQQDSFPANPPPCHAHLFSHLPGAPPWGDSGSTCGNPDRSHHKTAAGPGR